MAYNCKLESIPTEIPDPLEILEWDKTLEDKIERILKEKHINKTEIL